MPEKLLEEDWAPDFGERRIHPTAGVTAVGARKPLVAFNVNLATSDIGVAKRIARKVRASDGGFAHCKAIGVTLRERGIVQVSLNMTDCDATPLYVVYDAIRAEAERCGAPVLGGEIVGLAPASALIDCAKHYLRIGDFDADRQVLENRLANMES
jgi:glutamate formiminotransferase